MLNIPMPYNFISSHNHPQAATIQCHARKQLHYNVTPMPYNSTQYPQAAIIPYHTRTRPCMQNKPCQYYAVSYHIIPTIPFTKSHYQNQNITVPYHTIPPHKSILNPKSSTIPHLCLMVLLLLALVRNNWKL